MLPQPGDAAPQVAQIDGQLPGDAALVGMRVPAARRQKSQPQAAVVAHQGAQVLRVKFQANRVGCAVAGRKHLR